MLDYLIAIPHIGRESSIDKQRFFFIWMETTFVSWYLLVSISLRFPSEVPGHVELVPVSVCYFTVFFLSSFFELLEMDLRAKN